MIAAILLGVILGLVCIIVWASMKMLDGIADRDD